MHRGSGAVQPISRMAIRGREGMGGGEKNSHKSPGGGEFTHLRVVVVGVIVVLVLVDGGCDIDSLPSPGTSLTCRRRNRSRGCLHGPVLEDVLTEVIYQRPYLLIVLGCCHPFL